MIDTDMPTIPILEDIAAALERSEVQIADGHAMPLEPVLARLRASIARIETRRAGDWRDAERVTTCIRPALLPRLSLIVLRAVDPAGLARFYETFGMRFEAERHARGPLHYVSTDPGLTFEIYPRRAGEGDTTATRLGFATVALDVVLKAAVSAGGVLSTAPTATPWGRRAVICDPEGHKVELTEACSNSD